MFAHTSPGRAAHRLWFALCCGVVWCAESSADAQRGVLDVYAPSPTPSDDFALSRPGTPGHLHVGAQLHLDYALNPLVWEADLGDADSERFSVVEHELVGTLGLSLGLGDRTVVYLGMPLVLAMVGAGDGTTSAAGVAGADGFGPGDLSLGARVRLLGEPGDRFTLGVQATLAFPTSAGSAYRGDRTVSLRPALLGEVRVGEDVRLVFNVGALVRGESAQPTSNVVFEHELRLGAGIAAPVWTGDDARQHLDLLAQVQGGTAFGDFFGRPSSTAEATAGVRYTHPNGLTVGAVAGPGLARGFGSPDVRAAAMVGWATPEEAEAPPPVDPCADTPEDLDGFEDEDGCLDPDNDGDGFLDTVDRCPNEPETRNGWEDDEGCPDEIPDTDGDGLRDPDDACPTQPEDRDEFEDTDGCVDPDDDRDGVLDTEDSCRLEPGPVENHGCPDRDRDTDTVVDRSDNCPDVPGVPANFGCPARERQSVRIDTTQIVILDTVYFQTDRDVILSRSFGLLDNVAAVLRAHPEITRVVVEGHTDARGTREHNIDLSRRRAQAVVNYLVQRGRIDAARLEAIGYGPDRPVVPDARTPAQHAQNRRVVFGITSDAVRTESTGPGADTIDR